MTTTYTLRNHYRHDPNTKLRGVDPGIYEHARRIEQTYGWIDWTRSDVGDDAYWALAFEGVIDSLDGTLYELYQCSSCERYFPPGDTHVTAEGDEYCYDDTGNGCQERNDERLWAPPTTPRVEVEPVMYRALVRMNEWRNVYVTATNPIEARRLIEEEDWFGPEFPCESQTLDADFDAIETLEAL